MGTSAKSVSRLTRTGSTASRRVVQSAFLLSAAFVLASCADKPPPKKRSSEYFPESVYGVKASPRVVAYGDPVPQGGGRYLVGKPYTVKGKVYTPKEDKRYTAVGYASWYGKAFHGRRTANGEVYDMDTLSAAHPTMPLPSYARVTNLRNGSSLIVRVNDRGPYERNRVIDLSATAAELLDMKHHGSAKVKVEYVGPARMEGHDRRMLLATYVPPAGGKPSTAPAPAGTPGSTMFALRAPTTNPNIVLAMAPLPRSRPDSYGGVAIDPYNYEIQAASLDAPVLPQVRQPSVVVADSAQRAPQVAEPSVVRASASGDGYSDGGTSYGERTLGTFTTSDPTAFAPINDANSAAADDYYTPKARAGSARSSYAADSMLSPAQIAAEAMAYPGRQKLQTALNAAIERRAAERRADVVEIQVGVFSSADNAAAITGKIQRFGHVRIVPITTGSRNLQAVRLLVDPSVGTDVALAAVADAGARGAFVVTR